MTGAPEGALGSMLPAKSKTPPTDPTPTPPTVPTRRRVGWDRGAHACARWCVYVVMHVGRVPPARAVRVAGVREVRPCPPLQGAKIGGPEKRAVDGGAVGRKRTAVRRPRHANMGRPNTHAHPHMEDEGPPGGAAAQGPARGAAEGWRGRGAARGQAGWTCPRVGGQRPDRVQRASGPMGLLQLQPGLRAAPGC